MNKEEFVPCRIYINRAFPPECPLHESAQRVWEAEKVAFYLHAREEGLSKEGAAIFAESIAQKVASGEIKHSPQDEIFHGQIALQNLGDRAQECLRHRGKKTIIGRDM